MAIYFDYAATTPMSPEILATYTDALKLVGNPSSIHNFGRGARELLEEARESLALAVHSDRNEIVFTSGGTEGSNLAIKGLYWQRRTSTRNKIVSAYTEHHAVIDAIEWLEQHEGAEAIWAPVDEFGVVDLDWFRNYVEANADEIALATLMLANNETGIITDLQEFIAATKKHGIPFHVDAVAAFGYIPIDFSQLGANTLAISAHKVGGPVGVGALVVSRSTKLTALFQGGGQERGLRSGTMNAAGATAFAHAAHMALKNMDAHNAKTSKFVAQIRQVAQGLGGKFSRGEQAGLAHNAHFTFEGAKSDSMLFLLDQLGIAASAGSACQAGVARPSHVLMAMGRSEAEANGTLRFTLGAETTQSEVDLLLAELPGVIAKSRT